MMVWHTPNLISYTVYFIWQKQQKKKNPKDKWFFFQILLDVQNISICRTMIKNKQIYLWWTWQLEKGLCLVPSTSWSKIIKLFIVSVWFTFLPIFQFPSICFKDHSRYKILYIKSHWLGVTLSWSSYDVELALCTSS